jgi:hypothetical protein
MIVTSHLTQGAEHRSNTYNKSQLKLPLIPQTRLHHSGTPSAHKPIKIAYRNDRDMAVHLRGIQNIESPLAELLPILGRDVRLI